MGTEITANGMGGDTKPIMRSVWVILGDIVTFINQGRMGWLGMEDCCIPKKILKGHLCGRRTRGQLKTRWLGEQKKTSGGGEERLLLGKNGVELLSMVREGL